MLRTAINLRSKVTFCQQLYDILRDQIRRATWSPGDIPPSEAELIESYGVSHNTVRAVVDMLATDGFIYRERGRGTFVAKPRLEQTLLYIINFTEDMRRRCSRRESSFFGDRGEVS